MENRWPRYSRLLPWYCARTSRPYGNHLNLVHAKSAPVAGWYNAAHIPVGLASDTITYGSDVVASMYWSIGIDIVSGSRISTARTALHISIANLALAVACIGHEACVRLVVPVSTATNRRIPCITVEKSFVRDCMHCQ